MEITLCVPYSDGDPNTGFQYTGKAIGRQEYAKMMIAAYDKYKAGTNEVIMNNKLGTNIARLGYRKEPIKVKQSGYYFQDMPARIMGPRGRDITIDELIHYYQTGEPFIVTINMYKLGDVKNCDIESEIKSWAKECIKVNNCAKFSTAEKIAYLSKKDLKVKFNEAKSTAVLRDCKMIEYVNNRTFVFLVDEIVFITEG